MNYSANTFFFFYKQQQLINSIILFSCKIIQLINLNKSLYFLTFVSFFQEED